MWENFSDMWLFENFNLHFLSIIPTGIGFRFWASQVITICSFQNVITSCCHPFDCIYSVNLQIGFHTKPVVRHKWCWETRGSKPVWSPHLEQLCVWQTFGLLTTHRQEPSCSAPACQLSTQTWLWESQPRVYQSLDVTPLFQTSMPPLSQRASPQRCSTQKWTELLLKTPEFTLDDAWINFKDVANRIESLYHSSVCVYQVITGYRSLETNCLISCQPGLKCIATY